MNIFKLRSTPHLSNVGIMRGCVQPFQQLFKTVNVTFAAALCSDEPALYPSTLHYQCLWGKCTLSSSHLLLLLWTTLNTFAYPNPYVEVCASVSCVWDIYTRQLHKINVHISFSATPCCTPGQLLAHDDINRVVWHDRVFPEALFSPAELKAAV